MKTARVVVSVVSVGCVLAAAVACDDSSGTSSTFRESPPDAGGPGGDGSTPAFGGGDAGGPGSDASGPVSCNPYLPATFKPAWKAPTRASACSDADLSAYFDACLAPQGPDAGEVCKAWTDAHPGCRDCIEPADNSGPIQWHRDRYYYTLNVAGCLALERGEPGPEACPATYAASIQCQRDSCSGCFATPNASFSDFQKCQASAKGSACGSYEAKVGQVCGTTYNDPDGGAYGCFKAPTDTPKSHFVRVEKIFCGPQPPG